ncbi:sensor histidine kinase [Micromonospora sp. NPDC005305]|uniref:sensor histidine kinase n=1 Tax=Micromonospora sp. NPDC005305 TaxID=3156875 RepID=UPI0033B65768
MTAAAPPLPMRRLGPVGLVLADLLLAGAVAALCWYAALEVPQPPASGLHEPPLVSAFAGLALGAPVALRRQRPLIATAVVLVGVAATLVTGVIPDYAVAAPLTAAGSVLYTVALSRPARRSLQVLAVCVVVTSVAMLPVTPSPFGPGSLGTAFAALVLSAAWGVGWTVRERRAAARRSTERAVQEERLRIAREVHDIVAHGMGLIAVQAAVANHVAEERPQQARESLRVIESTSRGALAELRRVLGTLRPEPDLEPIPGLADLRSLVERTRAAGVPVDLRLRGAAEVPEGVGLAVFRIVQESLTNVVKHAGRARCRVEVTLSPGEVRIEVRDDGNPPPGRRDPAGQGLLGMRERVALYGGEFHAGPSDGAGYVVLATLPYGGAG